MSFLGFESGLGVGLTSPIFIAALPFGVAALIYAYLKRGRGTPVVVPSLLILRLLDRAQVARKRFVPPLRFFLELIILALLIAAAAGIYSQGSSERSAILIDNSFSMGAIDPANPSAGTYLSQALEQARLAIGAGKASDLEVFVTSPSFRSLSSGLVSVSTATSLLTEIKPEFANDNLQSALQKLSADPQFTRILVFSDKQLENTSANGNSGPRIGQSSRFQLFQVRDERVSAQNIALLDARLFKPGINASALSLSATVGNFSAERVETQLTLEMERAPDDPKDLRVVRHQKVSLKPGESAEYTFENLPALPIYQVYLDTANSAALSRVNSHLGDDQAWILSKPKKQEIAVISTEGAETLGFNRLKSLGIKHFSPADVTPDLLNSLASTQTLAIFHNVSPPELPALDAMFITPPEGDALFNTSKKVGGAGGDLKVTSWSESHPITTYLNFPALQLPEMHTFEPPAWAEKLIQTTEGSVAIAGEYNGKKYAAFGFELLPFRGSETPLRSVLFLNAIKWLSQLSTSANYEAVNQPLPILKELSDLVDISGKALELEALQSIKNPGLFNAKLKDGSKEFIAINFFDGAESNLLNPGRISLPTESLEVVSAPSSNSLRELLISIVALFLLLELFTWGLSGKFSARSLFSPLRRRDQNQGGTA